LQSNTVPKPSIPYRSREGIIFGVCRGFAEHFELPVLWIRIGVIASFVFTGFWPVGIGYLLVALLMKPEPVLPLKGPEDAEFYHSYATSRGMALLRLKRSFENLDRRIQRIEAIVTDPEFEWERRMNAADGE